jgi:hypothetical protein
MKGAANINITLLDTENPLCARVQRISCVSNYLLGSTGGALLNQDESKLDVLLTYPEKQYTK